MEGRESEAVFDAQNLNPQRFINEILNSIDDMLDGAFEFSLQKALEITASGDSSAERSEELARGVSSVRQLTQAVIEKRMEMWEKYCLRHCFSIPEGFVLPKSKDPSGDGLLFQEGSSDEELDSKLDSLRNKLDAAGKKSVELHKELHMLENQSAFSHSYHSYVTETRQLLEQNSAHKLFQEMGEAASKLQSKIEEAHIKRKGDNVHAWHEKTNSPIKKQHMTNDLDLFLKLEAIQEAAKFLRNV